MVSTDPIFFSHPGEIDSPLVPETPLTRSRRLPPTGFWPSFHAVEKDFGSDPHRYQCPPGHDMDLLEFRGKEPRGPGRATLRTRDAGKGVRAAAPWRTSDPLAPFPRETGLSIQGPFVVLAAGQTIEKIGIRGSKGGTCL